MNSFFKGLVGAAALMGVAMPAAQAQDYVFTFNVGFYDTFKWHDPDPGLNLFDNEGSGAGASGSFTLNEIAPAVYSVTAWSINTTAGTSGSNFAVFYSNTNNDDYAYTDDDFNQSITFVGAGDMNLTLNWAETGSLLAAILGNTPTSFDLSSGGSYEYQIPEAGNLLRLSGSCAAEDDPCETALFGSVSYTPPQIEPPPTATPEPASLALFGAGLLGLYAARRRRPV